MMQDISRLYEQRYLLRRALAAVEAAVKAHEPPGAKVCSRPVQFGQDDTPEDVLAHIETCAQALCVPVSALTNGARASSAVSDARTMTAWYLATRTSPPLTQMMVAAAMGFRAHGSVSVHIKKAQRLIAQGDVAARRMAEAGLMDAGMIGR